MRFSQETDYALRLVDFLSRQPDDDFINAKELSKMLSIPYRFLLRVLGKLKREGVLASKMGENGGYRLGRQPKLISIGEIVRAIEGHTPLVQCLRNSTLCNASLTSTCRVHKALFGIQKQIDELLDQYTFDSLDRGELDGMLSS